MSSKITAISLFSGCGGDTLGLERAGVQVVAFSEFNKAAIQTHQANFPESDLLLNPDNNSTDITKIGDDVFRAYKGINILFAGFPCQGFSHAGKKKANDPRNQLFRQFIRVAKLTQPDFIIGENVTGLRTMKSGPLETDPMMLDIIIKGFEEIGYKITYEVLEAKDFGVPQLRKRILLVGWKKSKYPRFDPASFWASVFAWGSQQSLPTLRSFVSDSLEDAYLLKENEVPEGFDENAILTTATVSGKPHPYISLKARQQLFSCSKRDSPIHSEIIHLDLPSKTIICTYDHQPRLLVGLKTNDNRRYVRCLLPDELKQIQGFPSSFQVLGNKKDQVVQIGNAVPPAFVSAVATMLKREIK